MRPKSYNCLWFLSNAHPAAAHRVDGLARQLSTDQCQSADSALRMTAGRMARPTEIPAGLSRLSTLTLPPHAPRYTYGIAGAFGGFLKGNTHIFQLASLPADIQELFQGPSIHLRVKPELTQLAGSVFGFAALFGNSWFNFVCQLVVSIYSPVFTVWLWHFL